MEIRSTSGVKSWKTDDDVVAEPLVAAEVAADEEEIAAELARPPPRHPTADPVAPGLVRCGEHHAAPDGDGPVPQRGSSSCSTDA